MTEQEKQDLHYELTHIKQKLYFALEYLEDLSKRDDVKGKLEALYFRVDDLTADFVPENTSM